MKKSNRYQACGCGRCGLINDSKHDICIIHVVGPEDQEQPIKRKAQQRMMRHLVKLLNENPIT